MTSRLRLVAVAGVSGRATSLGRTLKTGDVLLEGTIPDGLTAEDVVLALRRGIHAITVTPEEHEAAQAEALAARTKRAKATV